MARPASTYRAARRAAYRRARLLWRTHSATMRLGGGFRLGFHESLNPAFWQDTGRPTPRPEERTRHRAAG